MASVGDREAWYAQTDHHSTVAPEQLTELRRHAVNTTTRTMAARGFVLSARQVDELGDETIDWIRRRLDMQLSGERPGDSVTFIGGGETQHSAKRRARGTTTGSSTRPLISFRAPTAEHYDRLAKRATERGLTVGQLAKERTFRKRKAKVDNTNGGEP